MTAVSFGPSPARRDVLARRVRLLVAATITWNVAEAVVAITAGAISSSTALLGFGLDSVVEVSSAAAVAWQFSARDHDTREAREKTTLRVIALSFFVLAAYVTADSAHALAGGSQAGPPLRHAGRLDTSRQRNGLQPVHRAGPALLVQRPGRGRPQRQSRGRSARRVPARPGWPAGLPATLAAGADTLTAVAQHTGKDQATYDEEADVLYLSFRRPQRATDSEVRDDGIIVRKRGKEIVGLTILDASTRKSR